MPASETLTIRLPGATKKKLAKLAAQTRRTSSFLAGEAIQDFVSRESSILKGIEQGLNDVRAGRTLPHGEAMMRLRSTIADTQKKPR